jgi:hypothetical protein
MTKKTAPELLEAIRAKLRYQARSQICTLSPDDCASVLLMLNELEAARHQHLTQCIEIERDLRMQEVHKIALEDDRLRTPREIQCACCTNVFDSGTGSGDDKRCGSCINCVGQECR